ncbi:MAG: M48 family metalloprotease [bacterium]|nr:M48 family metalloprotease [bacterium]
MNMIGNIFSEKLINALGWTLIHSLWQGAVIALGFVVLMFFMRKYRPRTRYFTGIMALVLVLGLSAVTFVGTYRAETLKSSPVQSALNPAQVMAGDTLNSQSAARQNTAPGTGFFAPAASFFKNYFKQHLPLIVTIWLMGILVLMLRFAGGFLHNHRLKTQHGKPLPQSWHRRLEILCRKTGVSKPVALVESAFARVPMVIGYFKPVILIPAGLVTGLPRDQVEALLAHELAHIIRKDYLVNILQNVVDILFFYHPGIRWMSSLVRSERENCCDDIAVSSAGDSLVYAKALTNIQALGTGSLGHAMAITGNSPRLLNRIKRLLKPSKTRSEFTEGFVGAFIMIFCIFTLVVGANAAALMNPNAPTPGNETEISTTGETAAKEDTKETKKETEAEAEKKVQEFHKQLIKEKEQLKKELDRKNEELKRKHEELKRRDSLHRDELKRIKEELKQREKEARVHEFNTAKELVMQKEELARRAKELKENNPRNQKELARIKEELAKRHLELQKHQDLRKDELRRIKEELARNAGNIKLEQAQASKELAIVKENIERETRELELMEEKELAKMKAEHKRIQEELEREKRNIDKEHKFYNKITQMLRKDKLIDSTDDFEFHLTARGLTIDGVKQPASVFKKYKKMVEAHQGKIKKSGTFIIKSHK